MTKLKIIDLNRSLIQECLKAGLNAEWGDYFADIKPNEVLITASNPKWTFGGGLDAKFKDKFPQLIDEKQEKGGGMERIGNTVFAITVDQNLQSTPAIIEKAITFALSTLKENEVLRLSGIGTGIGGLDKSAFVEIVKKLSMKSPQE